MAGVDGLGLLISLQSLVKSKLTFDIKTKPDSLSTVEVFTMDVGLGISWSPQLLK